MLKASKVGGVVRGCLVRPRDGAREVNAEVRHSVYVEQNGWAHPGVTQVTIFTVQGGQVGGSRGKGIGRGVFDSDKVDGGSEGRLDRAGYPQGTRFSVGFGSREVEGDLSEALRSRVTKERPHSGVNALRWARCSECKRPAPSRTRAVCLRAYPAPQLIE